MQKLVALEKIKGLFSGLTYAEKYDELVVTIQRAEVSQFRNLKTNELLDMQNERAGMVDEAIIANYKIVVEETNNPTGRRKKQSNDKQINLFD